MKAADTNKDFELSSKSYCKKICCNASNSAAIDTKTGLLYVWGSSKNGLLGNKDAS
jgi:alpha-tubulin suppressor-like RCC1 family protein